MTSDERHILPTGYVLQSYELAKVIGRGSYGITYLAKDTYLNRKVAIKEYLPREYASRHANLSVYPVSDKQKDMFEWGLNNFLLEARTLAKFNHPNIIKVIGVVEKNNTAYMVMEYEDGNDLSTVYRKTGILTEQQLLHYFIPIIEGLSVVHNLGFIHRDIKPSNIYVRSDSSTVLLDFGSARQTVENDTDVLTTLVTAGFAPYEQYHQSKYDQGPWSDIYSLGATLYYCVAGNKPADALLRGSSLLKNLPDPYVPVNQLAKSNFSDKFLSAIDYALSFKIDDRPNNALHWSRILSGKESIKNARRNTGNDKRDFYPKTVPMDSNTIIPMNVVLASTTKNKTNYLLLTKSLANSYVAISNILKRRAKHLTTQIRSSSWLTYALFPLALLIIPISVAIYNSDASDIQIKHDNANQIIPSKNLTLATNTQSETKHKTPEALTTSHSIESSTNSKQITPLPTKVQTNNRTKSQTASQTTSQTTATIKRRQDEVVAFAQQVVIKDLLAQARFAVEQKRYSVPVKDNAIFHYQKVLALQPNHDKAKAGLKNIENRYIKIVNTYIERNSWRIAQKNIDKIAAISNSNSKTVIKLSNHLKNQKNRFAQTNNNLNQAKFLYEKSRLSKPKNKNALYFYNLALKLDPDNKQAQAGIDNIFRKLSVVLEKQIKAKRLKKSKRTYSVLESIDKNALILTRTLPLITTLQIEHEKIQKLLSAAKKDFINNRISLPKSNNALSKYNTILDIDKNNTHAKAGIKQIFTYYVSNYYRQIDSNNFSRAKKTLNSLKNIGYAKKKLITLRKFAKLEKKTRINTAIILSLLNRVEIGLNTRNLKMLEKFSIFKTKNKKYIAELMNNYSDYSVNITQKNYSKKHSRTTARVVLSDLESVDDDLFVIPDDIKISIKVKKNKSKNWKVYW